LKNLLFDQTSTIDMPLRTFSNTVAKLARLRQLSIPLNYILRPATDLHNYQVDWLDDIRCSEIIARPIFEACTSLQLIDFQRYCREPNLLHVDRDKSGAIEQMEWVELDAFWSKIDRTESSWLNAEQWAQTADGREFMRFKGLQEI
jgi:hypothetical protein